MNRLQGVQNASAFIKHYKKWVFLWLQWEGHVAMVTVCCGVSSFFFINTNRAPGSTFPGKTLLVLFPPCKRGRLLPISIGSLVQSSMKSNYNSPSRPNVRPRFMLVLFCRFANCDGRCIFPSSKQWTLWSVLYCIFTKWICLYVAWSKASTSFSCWFGLSRLSRVTE